MARSGGRRHAVERARPWRGEIAPQQLADAPPLGLEASGVLALRLRQGIEVAGGGEAFAGRGQAVEREPVAVPSRSAVSARSSIGPLPLRTSSQISPLAVLEASSAWSRAISAARGSCVGCVSAASRGDACAETRAETSTRGERAGAGRCRVHGARLRTESANKGLDAERPCLTPRGARPSIDHDPREEDPRRRRRPDDPAPARAAAARRRLLRGRGERRAPGARARRAARPSTWCCSTCGCPAWTVSRCWSG